MKLSQDLIAMVALDLVTESGAERLTMQKLADRLGVRPSSLYNHIDGKAEVVELIRGLIVERIDTAPFLDQPWDRALTAWGRSYLFAFAAYPGVIRLLATTPITSVQTLRMYEIVLTGLAAGGWPDTETLAVMRTTEAFVLGSALDFLAPATLLTADAVPSNLPVLGAALAPERIDLGSAVRAFEVGFAALVAGLRSQLAALQT